MVYAQMPGCPLCSINEGSKERLSVSAKVSRGHARLLDKQVLKHLQQTKATRKGTTRNGRKDRWRKGSIINQSIIAVQ